MSLSTQVLNQNKNFVMSPTNFSEAMNYAKLISDSSFCPREFKGKSGDVLIAMQMGAEVGLSPMQALQNIAVINGKPCIYGDAALAVVISHPCYISHREWIEGSEQDGTLTAYCAITRKNSEEYVTSFSMEDAKKAGLWGKAGVWQQYKKRMLQMRARSFCVRDKFADALRGISVREEVEDYNIKVIKKPLHIKNTEIDVKKIDIIETEKVVSVITDHNIDKDILDISWARDMDDLQTIYVSAYKYWLNKKDKENMKQCVDAKDKRKVELENIIVETVVDTETGEVK